MTRDEKRKRIIDWFNDHRNSGHIATDIIDDSAGLLEKMAECGLVNRSADGDDGSRWYFFPKPHTHEWKVISANDYRVCYACSCGGHGHADNKLPIEVPE